MLNRIRKRRSHRRDDHGAPIPDRADLRIRDLLEYPELQAVMASSTELGERDQVTPAAPIRRIEHHRRATADLFDVAA